MDQSRFQQIYDLFIEVRNQPADECRRVLNAACAEDVELRAEIEALLEAEADPLDLMRIAEQVQEMPSTVSEQIAHTVSCNPGVPITRTQASKQRDDIDGYKVIREISRGGQGVIYLAEQQATNRKVAIKLLVEGRGASAATERRFDREIQLVAQLKHPNIVTIFHSGTTRDGQPFYVMDFVRGRNLDVHIEETKPTLHEALRLFMTICDAVQYAHHRGIIHRDLKPSNVIVDVEARPRLLDFGLAKWVAGPSETMISMSHHIMGTLAYMAPEQTRSNPDAIDTRTDVYALGVILYQMLTGAYPYAVNGDLPDVLRNISESPPAAPSAQWSKATGIKAEITGAQRRARCPIDDEVQTIVLRALAKEPERRYQSAGELARDVGHYLAGEPIEAKRDSRLYVIRKTIIAYKKIIVMVVLGTAVVTLAVIAGINWHRERRHAAATDKLFQAVRLVVAREQLPQSRVLLNEALALDADLPDAHIYLGILTALEGLDRPLESKAGALDSALEEFRLAHELAGGRWPTLAGDHVAVQSASGRGSRTALLYAAQICELKNDLAQAKTCQILAETIDDPGAAEVLPIYDIDKDDLIAAPHVDSPGASFAIADRNAVVHRSLKASIETLNPLYSQSINAHVTELLFDTMFHISPTMVCTANDGMVEEVRNHENIVEVRLNPGTRWHDDTPLTAADVEFTWDHMPEGHMEKESILSVDAVDTDVVRIQFRQIVDDYCWDLRWPILPRRHFEQLQALYPNADDRAIDVKFGRDPIGNGPYRLVEWGSRHIELRRWEDYPGEAPYMQSVVFEISVGGRERLEAIASGEIDEAQLTAHQFRWGANGESFADRIIKIKQPREAYAFICWNTVETHGPYFSDRRVRRALTMAMDLENVIANQFAGLKEQCHGIYPWFDYTTLLPFNPEESHRILERAGWLLGANGIRQFGGTPFEFEILVPDESEEAHGVVLDLVADLREVGVVMKIIRAPWHVCRQRMESGDFQAVLSQTTPRTNPARASRRWRSHGNANYGQYSNPEVDALFTQARLAPGDDQIALYLKIHELTYRDQPYTFLYIQPAMWALNKDLRGVRVSPVGITGFYPGARAWWFAKGN